MTELLGIPKDYYVSAKKDASDSSSVSQSGFRKETYADGKTVGVITSCTIYYAVDIVDALYRLGHSDLVTLFGIVLCKEIPGFQFTVLPGIYVIVFIIKKGTDYGLSVYDHIVLDANAVTGNGMIIYQ